MPSRKKFKEFLRRVDEAVNTFCESPVLVITFIVLLVLGLFFAPALVGKAFVVMVIGLLLLGLSGYLGIFR